MTNQPHDRPSGRIQFNEQNVIQPGPVPVSWMVAMADFPNPLKGSTVKMVVLDAYTQQGMSRYFVEPDVAADIANRLAEAAKMAKAGGMSVIEGAAAQAISQAARKANAS